MVATAFNIVFNGFLQLLAALLLAPLLSGIIKRTKAFLQGRTGPIPLQVYRDITKMWGKEAVVSTHASVVSLWAPWIIAAAVGAASLYIPIMSAAPLHRIGDLFIAVYLFALARLATGLLGLDGATNFGGMGTGREMAVGALTEPVLLVSLLGIALPAGTTGLTNMTHYLAAVGLGGVNLSYLLAMAALGVVLVAETGRIPVDNPDTHLELTMMHESMILDVSGWHLALITWANSVKQFLLCSLLANLVLPWYPAGRFLPAVLFYLGKVLAIGLALAAVETAYAKMRLFKLPHLLGFALLLGILGVLFGLWGL